MSSDPNKKVKVLFACLDWRLHPQIEEYFTKAGDGADSCVTAGSIKSLIDPKTRDFMVEQVSISKKLHNCQGAILTMHMDCGAYGGSAAFETRQAEVANCMEQLKTAKAVIKENFPGLPVESYIIGLEHGQNGWNIIPEAVEV